MPKTDHQAVLEVSEIAPIMAEAKRTSVLAYALTAWMYEFGARGAELGLQLLKDLDMKRSVARPMHLKQGKPPAWHKLLPFCREALPLWLNTRTTLALNAQQALYLFPSSISTGRCYTCAGTGKRPVLKRDGKKRFRDGTKPCHHCNATGERWGIDRREVYEIVHGVLKRAGMSAARQHPHVLRHSIITHMLDGGAETALVQDRVGHKHPTTTLEYARATQAAIDNLESKMSKVYS